MPSFLAAAVTLPFVAASAGAITGKFLSIGEIFSEPSLIVHQQRT
jgi:hypothetical protein